jgi:predicted transposase YbfD/YdcC
MKESLILYEIVKDIKDPRLDRKKRHLLVDILIIAIAAVICGADNWNEIERFGKSKLEWFKKFLELPNGIPSHDTFNRVFSLLNPEYIEDNTVEVFKKQIEVTREHIAIDGKTVRRSHNKKSDIPAIHIVSAWLCKTGISLGQIKVDDKSNEIIAIPELLDKLDIKHSIISIDAMGTQKKIAEKIIDKKGDYVLSLKENHPILYNEVESFFQTNLKTNFEGQKYKYTVTQDKGHGRIEKREYWFVSNTDFLSQKDEWKELNSIGMVRSEIIINDKTTINYRYYISSLKNAPILFRNSIRNHWKIETSCHWVLDVAFREDESRTRKGYSAENFASLRKIALNLLKNEKSIKIGIKGKRLNAGWDENYLLKVLGINTNC